MARARRKMSEEEKEERKKKRRRAILFLRDRVQDVCKRSGQLEDVRGKAETVVREINRFLANEELSGGIPERHLLRLRSATERFDEVHQRRNVRWFFRRNKQVANACKELQRALDLAMPKPSTPIWQYVAAAAVVGVIAVVVIGAIVLNDDGIIDGPDNGPVVAATESPDDDVETPPVVTEPPDEDDDEITPVITEPPDDDDDTPPVFPDVDFRANPEEIYLGEEEDCAYLEWEVENAESVTVDGSEAPLSGRREVCPEGTTTYTLEAVGPGGDVTESSTTVEVIEPTPEVDIVARRFFTLGGDGFESFDLVASVVPDPFAEQGPVVNGNSVPDDLSQITFSILQGVVLEDGDPLVSESARDIIRERVRSNQPDSYEIADDHTLVMEFADTEPIPVFMREVATIEVPTRDD